MRLRSSLDATIAPSVMQNGTRLSTGSTFVSIYREIIMSIRWKTQDPQQTMPDYIGSSKVRRGVRSLDAQERNGMNEDGVERSMRLKGWKTRMRPEAGTEGLGLRVEAGVRRGCPVETAVAPHGNRRLILLLIKFLLRWNFRTNAGVALVL